MRTNNGTLKIQAEISLGAPSAAMSPVVVHQETRLEALEPVIPDSHYVLATDSSGCIVGLIQSEEILKRLQSANFRERTRWAEMPLSSLIKMIISTRTEVPVAVASGTTAECTAISENGRLVGIAIDKDVFLSWHRLEPMLSGAAADPLTGLMNRLAYERRLREEWHRSQRTGVSIGILLVDLDHFKIINDEYGHAAGDEVIRCVARKLEESVRSYDLVARYGGDEFIALCLGCRPTEIEIPVRRIMESLQSDPPLWNGIPLPLSASVGAAVRHDGFTDSDPMELFQTADHCLYQAKTSRRAAYRVEFGSSESARETLISGQEMKSESPGGGAGKMRPVNVAAQSDQKGGTSC